jgi:glycosyltransferase involved in cell wall biosynthesis
MVKISFITFTKNSGIKLKFLLEHVKDVVDEIIVIDGYSTDNTAEIAKSFGAKVYLRKPWGFVEPDRMFALKKASYYWILYLDDDERLNNKLKNELKDILDYCEKEGYDALSILRIDYDRRCNGLALGSFYNRQIRVVKKDKALYKGLIHELPIIRGRVLELPEEYYILHFPNINLRKLVKYAYIEVLEKYKFTTKSKIKSILWKLSPFSIIAIWFYYLIFDIAHKKLYGVCTIKNEFYLAIYETLIHTLIKFRSMRREIIAKIISSYGLIQILNLDQ